MPTLSQVLGGSRSLWHLPRHAGSIARLGPQDRFRSARFRGSGHGDSDQAGKMAQRLRSIFLSDHCLRSQSSRRLQQRRVRQGEQHRRGTAAGHIFRADLSMAHRRGDEGRRPVRQSRRLQRAGYQQGARQRRLRRLCTTHAHHARCVSGARRARSGVCRRAHIHEQRGVLAGGQPGNACASSRCRPVFIRDDRERHVFALQHRSARAGAGLEGAAPVEDRARGIAVRAAVPDPAVVRRAGPGRDRTDRGQ